MATVTVLPAHKLRISTDMKHIPWESSDHIPTPRNGAKYMLQPRALKAMELALYMQNEGYNVYLCGGAHVGRSYIVREILTPHARKAQTPKDIIYLYNFSDADKPILLRLPAGQGRIFKKMLQDVVSKIRKELPRHFETELYITSRSKILDAFQETKSGILKRMNELAKAKGFSLDVDDNSGVTLYPLVEGKRLSEDEFEHLETETRQVFKRKADALMNSLSGHMRHLSRVEQELRENEKELERTVAVRMLEKILKPVQESFLRKHPDETLKKYLDDFYKDILNNLDSFTSRDGLSSAGASHMGLDLSHAMQGEPDLSRYDINVFVDNTETKGAPLIFEQHPTVSNLLGCIERESEMGALITDFSLIKSGSLHKANGGYLVIRIDDIIQHYQAWEGLLRSLRSGYARIEDANEGQDSAARTKSIEPQPVDLQVKVILIGSEGIYETLLEGDERFSKLFRIKAHLSEQSERNATTIRYYLQRIKQIINKTQLPTFDKSALAWLVDYGSRLVEDQRRLSLKFPRLREIMMEASALAAQQGQTVVNAAFLQLAADDKHYRANLVQDVFLEEYDRNIIKVRTWGQAVGLVNGLSVTGHGDFEFGLPHQISCTVGVGHGGIIDLEREAELGGPIHTKAIMILKSYLTALFARRHPIVLTGSICIEQCYAGIEGDSASGAELVSLLSAIAEVPVRLDLAFTGALNQSGQIMAVGGVSHKIEGFFNVCARHGLTGTQGVLIPHDNVENLMLSPSIVEAVQQGKFSVYPIKHIDEALELLTGLSAGKRRKDDSFTKGSLYALVATRLQSLCAFAAKDVRVPKKPVQKKAQKATVKSPEKSSSDSQNSAKNMFSESPILHKREHASKVLRHKS